MVSTSIFDSYNFKEYQLFYYVCIAYMLSYSVVSDSLQTHDYSSPGSSVHEIFQARILVWIAISSSRGSYQCRLEPSLLHQQAISLPLSPLGSPFYFVYLTQFLINGSRRVNCLTTYLLLWILVGFIPRNKLVLKVCRPWNKFLQSKYFYIC